MENIAKKSNTEFILNTFNLKPSKKYGQNFLVDPGIIQSIADHASLDKETAVIEIGPGIGALTEQLSNKAGKVLCFEIDERLKEVLSFSLEGHDNVEIIFQDFMKADLEEACNKLKDYKDICVVTNLPYYITSKIITKIVSSSTPINRLVAMVQKEVALKLCSEEKSPLKMMIDYVGDVQYELNVPRHVFMPAPHIDSAVISIHKERVISQELIDLIEASYTAKRKTLYNNLKSLYHDQTKEVLESCGIPANKRAEELNIDDYIRILERSHKL